MASGEEMLQQRASTPPEISRNLSLDQAVLESEFTSVTTFLANTKLGETAAQNPFSKHINILKEH